MRKIKISTALKLFFFAVALCAGIVAAAPYSKIVSAQEAKKLIEKGVAVIDVRTPEEFSAGHIPGAVNINFYDKDFEKLLSKLDREKEYLVYCRSGNRSGKSVTIMKKLGFSVVYDMQAYSSWQQSGYPEEK